MRENPQWRLPEAQIPKQSRTQNRISLAAPYFSRFLRPLDPPVHAIITKSTRTICTNLGESVGHVVVAAIGGRAENLRCYCSLSAADFCGRYRWRRRDPNLKHNKMDQSYSLLSLQVSIVLCRKEEERIMTGIIHAAQRVACVRTEFTLIPFKMLGAGCRAGGKCALSQTHFPNCNSFRGVYLSQCQILHEGMDSLLCVSHNMSHIVTLLCEYS